MEIINPPFSLKRKELPVTKTCPSKRFKSLESEQSKYQDGIEEGRNLV